MASSTFYDLLEVRQHLRRMIEDELGYRALISESSSFPIDVDATTIENCRRRVEQDADVLVLLIGRRYGSVEHRSGKSITNIEYSAARAKGIPIYAFVDRGLLVLYDARRTALEQHIEAFDAAVDDPRLYEFLKRVRVTDSVWMNGFDVAEDITKTLRTQLAYLMTSGLIATAKLNSNPNRQLLLELPPEAFRIAVDQPRVWEHLLFAEMLRYETASSIDLKRQYDLGLSYGAEKALPIDQVPPFFSARIGEVRSLVNNLNTLLNETLQTAFAPPGVPANVREIIFIARQLGKIYRRLLEWTEEVRLTRIDDDLQPAIKLLATASENAIMELSSWGDVLRGGIQAAVDDVVSNPPPQGETRIIDFPLRIMIDENKMNEMIEILYAGLRRRGVEI